MEYRDTVNAFPLAWPTGWSRAKRRDRSRFRIKSMIVALEDIYHQLERMAVRDRGVIVSSNVALRLDGRPRSNQKRPEDPGVAVYFELKGEKHALACDRWNSPEENLWAICKHVEALRGQERWGVGSLEQAFGAYKALPPQEASAARKWWRVLEFESVPSSIDQARASYRRLSKERHPDTLNGTEDAFRELGKAIADGFAYFAKASRAGS